MVLWLFVETGLGEGSWAHSVTYLLMCELKWGRKSVLPLYLSEVSWQQTQIASAEIPPGLSEMYWGQWGAVQGRLCSGFLYSLAFDFLFL